ncbi:cytochrome C oxidase Cbb3 [Fulvivirga ulvae]|uniref:cytochrome C oxidase Cbb3 n=1 Tax=Fulvivirga ulvae TaxID=2904245 RepID=UPI001F24DA46|nr:cytochrome C oxidase Cbb3 [Fulvivirga ulvae]UII30456.1 cytochrome C oxidase Cbb3 [Fulvivirga ulvae]
MFKHYFEQIHQVEIWPIISLSIFFIFFLGLILWVVKMDKDYVSKMKNLPVNEDGSTLSTVKTERS